MFTFNYYTYMCLTTSTIVFCYRCHHQLVRPFYCSLGSLCYSTYYCCVHKCHHVHLHVLEKQGSSKTTNFSEIIIMLTQSTLQEKQQQGIELEKQQQSTRI